MFAPLSVEFRPFDLAQKGAEFEGRIPLSHFKRLVSYLADVSGEVRVQLKFARSGGIRYLRGELEAGLHLCCQRCMEPMVWPLKRSFLVGFVSSDAEADELPEEYEPMLVEVGTTIHQVDLLEDELILSLPLVPKHVQGESCIELEISEETTSEVVESKQEKPAKRPNPFAVLKGLQRDEQ